MFRIVVIKRVCKSHCWNVGCFNGRRVDYIRLKKKGGLVSYSKGYIYKIVMLMKTRQYACLFVVSNAYYKISLTELKWFNTDVLCSPGSNTFCVRFKTCYIEICIMLFDRIIIIIIHIGRIHMWIRLIKMNLFTNASSICHISSIIKCGSKFFANCRV